MRGIAVLTIRAELVDVETAKQAGRGGFADMIAFLKATPTCRIVLVEKTNRLSRNFRDYLALEDLEYRPALREGEHDHLTGVSDRPRS